jgi:acetamidase/formamidase
MKRLVLHVALTTAFVCACALSTSAAPVKPDHHLRSLPENISGFWDAAAAPVLKIKSGESVEIDTLSMFGMSDDKPEQFFIDNGISLDLPAVQDMIAVKKALGSKPGIRAGVLTGPIFVEGAMPGDMIEVRILAIKSRVPYGVNQGGPGRGGIPDLVPRPYAKVIKLDLARNVALFSPEVEVPLHQFMGKIGVAPTPDKGALPSGPPYPDIGGNFDNRYFTAGATIYLPVHVEGALFQTGDPHAAQGNGEVSQSALESCNAVTMQFFVRKDLHAKAVFAENATHLIAIGLDQDLDVAMHSAIVSAVELIQARYALDFFDSLSLCSVAVDFEVTQVVDGTKGIHAMIPKSVFKKYDPSAYWFKGPAAIAAVETR